MTLSEEQGDNRVLATRLQPATTLNWRDIAGVDELLLFDQRSGRHLSLNPVASVVWRALAAGQDLRSVIDDLAASHQATPAQVQADVIAFVQQALDAGLLQRDGEPVA
jgi:hypothetical protein